jgi:hypothetical protein
MSKESAREADPLISDPELERDRLVAEGIEAALLQSIQAQAADPNGPYQPDDLAYIAMQVQSNKMGLPEAIRLHRNVHKNDKQHKHHKVHQKQCQVWHPQVWALNNL